MELYHWGILGMKWGVRRYENPDGTLTEAGKRRYAREESENSHRKKKKEEFEMKDPNRWVKEDLTRSKRLADESSNLTRNAMDLEKNLRFKKKRMDLSEMTDKEMRDRINREFLERQYDDLFNQQKISKGREHVREVLALVGSTLGVVSSSLGIALTVKELKG